MTELTTSATKLYNILKEFKEYEQGDSLASVWGKILGAKNSDDLMEVSGKLSQLFVLCNEVKLDIKSIEDFKPKRIYLKASERIELIFHTNDILYGNYKNLNYIQSAIHPDTLGLIDASGEIIKQSQALKEIDSNKLEELKEKVTSLRDEIKESDIEADLNFF